MSKKRKTALTIICLLCVIVFFPLVVTKRQVAGIAVNAQGYLAVAVNSVYSGDASGVYIYSEDDKLLKKIELYGFRGGVGTVREENDLLAVYFHNSKYTYDFDGTLLLKETVDERIFPSTSGYKGDSAVSAGSTEYVYSKNMIGFEKVKKLTADGKSKTVFKGIALYINKLLRGIFVTAWPTAMLYWIVSPFLKSNFSIEDFYRRNITKEDFQNYNAKIQEIFREKGNVRKKLKVSVYLFIAAVIIVQAFFPLIFACKSAFADIKG